MMKVNLTKQWNSNLRELKIQTNNSKLCRRLRNNTIHLSTRVEISSHGSSLGLPSLMIKRVSFNKASIIRKVSSNRVIIILMTKALIILLPLKTKAKCIRDKMQRVGFLTSILGKAFILRSLLKNNTKLKTNKTSKLRTNKISKVKNGSFTKALKLRAVSRI